MHQLWYYPYVHPQQKIVKVWPYTANLPFTEGPLWQKLPFGNLAADHHIKDGY